jgi:DNA modification methylase
MSEQNSLNLEETGGVDSVEKYKFDPIKGYPMLNWNGKRPFTSTQYYPTQKKEIYGEEVNGWINKIFWGDNLQVMSHLLKEYRGKIDLVYIDPPFDSNADYKKKIKLRGKSVLNDQNSFEEKQYTDIWSNDEYLQFMYERIILLKELLSEKGSIFLHCDHRKSHHLRCILDEVFGSNNYKGTITREKCNPKNYTSQSFGNIADVILFYSKSESNIWSTLYEEMSKEKIISSFSKVDGNGRRYKTAPLHADEERNGETGDAWRGIMPPPGGHWRYVHSTLDKLDADGLIEWSSTGNPRKIVYADESKGIPLQDIWLKIKDGGGEYPTQKNEKLLDRIIKATTERGSIVFDCFMGSGTTQIVALKNGRKFLGADVNLGAIQISTKRLNLLRSELSQRDIIDGDNSNGFEVYNVNNYDVFRNPAEAKSLLLEALEIEGLSGSIYDGKKDGCMVKVMPVNRIATREDLNELLANFPYKTFNQRKEDNPNKAVESIMLICMGHEADLKAHLEQECGYKLNVDVVDILRDKSNIEFKRDSEAVINISNNNLIIEHFYPMNLLQKLSMQKESVEEWKELVESIVVDWNYDGSAMEPSVVDIPGKKDFVSGVYSIPLDAGTIKIKITDLLSESYEEVIKHG